MIQVVEVVKTCEACPAQWEGTTSTGERVYARYRWGYLYVTANGSTVFEEQLDVETPEESQAEIERLRNSDWDEEIKASMIASRELARKHGAIISYDGELSFEQLKRATIGVIKWPLSETPRWLRRERHN